MDSERLRQRMDLAFRPYLPITLPVSSGCVSIVNLAPSSATWVWIITNSGWSTSAQTIFCSSLEARTSLGSDNEHTPSVEIWRTTLIIRLHLRIGLSFQLLMLLPMIFPVSSRRTGSLAHPYRVNACI